MGACNACENVENQTANIPEDEYGNIKPPQIDEEVNMLKNDQYETKPSSKDIMNNNMNNTLQYGQNQCLNTHSNYEKRMNSSEDMNKMMDNLQQEESYFCTQNQIAWYQYQQQKAFVKDFKKQNQSLMAMAQCEDGKKIVFYKKNTPNLTVDEIFSNDASFQQEKQNVNQMQLLNTSSYNILNSNSHNTYFQSSNNSPVLQVVDLDSKDFTDFISLEQKQIQQQQKEQQQQEQQQSKGDQNQYVQKKK